MLEVPKTRKQAVSLTLPQEQLECLRYWADKLTDETGQYVSLSQVVAALVNSNAEYPTMLNLWRNSKNGEAQNNG